MYFTIEINLTRLKLSQNPIDLDDILLSLKHLNYSEINIKKNIEITIKFVQKYDFELCLQLLREWGISDKNIHQNHTNKVTCPPPIPATNLKYKYFAKDNHIFNQMKAAMKLHPQFLVQTLHLMNKFNLPPPESIIKMGSVVASSNPRNFLADLPDTEDEETEIDEDDGASTIVNPVTMPFKRKAHLPKIGVDKKRNKMFEEN